jgi:uncharacterized RDD family membrane protein YckC
MTRQQKKQEKWKDKSGGNKTGFTLTILKKASFWKRLIACFIDNLTIAIIVVLTSEIFGLVEIIENLLAFLLFYGYGTITEYYKQLTLGKFIMKLKVIGANGQRLTFLNSFYRNFGKNNFDNSTILWLFQNFSSASSADNS